MFYILGFRHLQMARLLEVAVVDEKFALLADLFFTLFFSPLKVRWLTSKHAVFVDSIHKDVFFRVELFTGTKHLWEQGVASINQLLITIVSLSWRNVLARVLSYRLVSHITLFMLV